MGFQHPKQKQDMMAGRMAAASSLKTPGHLKAHQQRLAGAPNVKLTSLSRTFMPTPDLAVAAKAPKSKSPLVKSPVRSKMKAKLPKMKISSGPGCAIYG